MKRLLTISGVLAFVAVLVCCRIHNGRLDAEYHEHGRAIARGLNGIFLTNPKYINIHIHGYTGSAGILAASGQFVVSGYVASTNDLISLQTLVRSMQPPGQLVFHVTVRPPPPPPAAPARNFRATPPATNAPPRRRQAF